MITLKRKCKKKNILRITLITIVGLVTISGVSVYLYIQSFIGKINLKTDHKDIPYEREEDVFYDETNESINWDTYIENTKDHEVINESTVNSDNGVKDIPTINNSTMIAEEAEDALDGAEIIKETIVNQAISEKNLEEEALYNLNQLVENNLKDQTNYFDNENITHVLFIVSENDDINDSDNSDNIILLSISQEEGIICSTTFSQQIYLQIPYNDNNNLYSAYHRGGAELLMETISKNFKINIDRYITTDETSFQTLLDTISGDKLDMEKMNETLNSILPKVTTNLKQNEILSFVLMMPTYMSYEQISYSIPLAGTYESYQIRGVEVLGIDFEKNIQKFQSLLVR